MVRRTRRGATLSPRGEAGVSSIVGFAVAVAIYGITFAAFLTFVQSPGHTHSDASELGTRASGGLDVIVGSDGQDSQAGVTSWHQAPDKITRFGLAQHGEPGVLDLDKMKNLTKGNFSKDSGNNLLDYDEAKDGLGLGGYEFHLRTYPLISTLEDGGLHPIRGMKVAYVGDYTQHQQGGGSDYLVQYATSVEERGGVVFANVTITNNGTGPTVFQTEFQVPFRNATISETQTTALLAPYSSGSQVASLKLYKTPKWEWATSNHNLSVNISDPNKVVASFRIDLAGINMTAGGGASGYAMVYVNPDKMYFKPNEKPKLKYNLVKGDGTLKDDKAVSFTLTVNKASDGSLIESTTGKFDKDNKNSWTMGSAQAAGNYTTRIYLSSNSSFDETDRFDAHDNADVGSFTPTTATTTDEEIWSAMERKMLLDLVDGFSNLTYDFGGDVYPDQKKVMNNDLADNLTAGKYDALIVGSSVDQNAMTSNAAKDAVRDYVLNGGLLIVLGSTGQSVTWLEPLFNVALTTSGDPVSTPDPTHPILHTPEELAYNTYTDNGHRWQFNSAGDATHFTHVITGGTSDQVEDTLALSKPGHFGNGSIVLTGWMPYALKEPQEGLEAERVLYNFLLQALGSLYIDFGPPIPPYAEVASSTRLATAPHPAIPTEQVLVRLVLYVFR